MVTCINCKSKQNLIFEYQGFKYYKCIKCQLVSTYPIPDKKTIRKHYKDGFERGNYKFARQYAKQYEEIYKGFIKEIIDYLSKNNKEIKNLELLDIGCYTGDFVYLISKRGVKVNGIELQNDAVKIANKKLPGKIKQMDVCDMKSEKNKFDIITMFGVLEHVENPPEMISKASLLLKKDGIVVIQTPNSNSIFARALGKYWPPYTPVEHIHLYNKDSIQLLLKKNKMSMQLFKNHYKILPIAYVYNAFGIFGPEFKKILDKLVFFYDFNKSSRSLPFYIGEMFIIAKKDK